MDWVKLAAVPAYYADAAILRAGEAAEVMFTRALAYCGHHETAGVVDKAVLPLICPVKPQQRAAALVREGLWVDQGDTYLVRSWEKWQDEHDAAADRRRKDRERKRDKRRQERGQDADVSADIPRTPSGQGAESPLLDRDRDREKNKDTAGKPAADPDGFADWWSAYPRREDKGHARTAYRRALGKTDAPTLLAAAEAYARTTRQTERRFIALPATWLNGERWADETSQRPAVGSYEAAPDWMK